MLPTGWWHKLLTTECSCYANKKMSIIRYPFSKEKYRFTKVAMEEIVIKRGSVYAKNVHFLSVFVYYLSLCASNVRKILMNLHIWYMTNSLFLSRKKKNQGCRILSEVVQGRILAKTIKGARRPLIESGEFGKKSNLKWAPPNLVDKQKKSPPKIKHAPWLRRGQRPH